MKTMIGLTMFLCVASLLAACGGTTPASPTAVPVPQATPTVPQPTATPQATTAPEPSAAATVPPERIAEAQTIADEYVRGDYAAVEARFDATMKSMLPVEKLKEGGESLAASTGAFKGQVGTRAQKYEQSGVVYDIVYVTLEYEKLTLDFQVVFDPAGLIAGLRMMPAQSGPVASYEPPAYVDTGSFREQEVTVGSGEWALSGTLTLPAGDGPFPAVVLVHGSGPNDRDETIGPNKPFRDLAGGLASRGIAVLRYEKRTKQYAAKFTGDMLAQLTVNEEVVDDALAAVVLLRQTPGIDPARVYVLGHSLGGMMLPRIGAADPEIAGLIFLAGPTRPLEDLVLDQSIYLAGLDGVVSAEDQAALDTLRAQVARVKAPDLSAATPAADLLLGVPANYWLDLRGYQPAEVAAGLTMPMLILQGGRDYQVTTVDFDGWKSALAAHANVQFKLYPSLNHLFVEGEGQSSPNEYELAGHVAEPVILDIAGWITSLATP